MALQDVRMTRPSQISIPGYNFFVKGSSKDKNTAGGVLIGFPKNWKGELIDTDIDGELTAILKDEKGNRLILANVYNRPRAIISDAYLDHLSNIITEFHNLPTIIVGDINSPKFVFGSRTTSALGRKLGDWILDNDLKNVKCDHPTYISSSKSRNWNILDYIILNNRGEKIVKNVEQIADVGSDHIPFKITLAFKGKTGKFQVRKINKLNQKLDAEKFLETLSSIPDHPTTLEIDTYVDNITEALTKAKENNTSSRTTRFKDGVELSARLNKLLLNMRKLSNRQKLNDNENVRKECNFLKKASIRNNESLDYVKKINKAKKYNDSRRKWITINEVLDRNIRDNQPIIKLRKLDGKLTKDIGEVLNTHADRLQASCSTADDPWMNNGFKDQIETYIRDESFSFEPLNQIIPEDRDEEILKFIPSDDKLREDINHLKKYAAAGPDNLHNEDIINTGPNFRFHFIKLSRAYMMKGYFPASFKMAVVKILPKPGKDLTISKSYRPISLTNTLAKLLEKYMTRALEFILDKYGPKLPRQCGFEQNRSTMEGVFKLVQDSNTANKKNGCTVAVFLDLARAFDAVWHDGLRRKLKAYHIPPKLTRIYSEGQIHDGKGGTEL